MPTQRRSRRVSHYGLVEKTAKIKVKVRDRGKKLNALDISTLIKAKKLNLIKDNEIKWLSKKGCKTDKQRKKLER